MPRQTHSYLSPKLEARDRGDDAGTGVFAVEPIMKGETISVWSGELVSGEKLQTLPPEIQMHTVQVEEDLYLASLTPDEAADYVNHSCSPNAGLKGQIVLVALRDIAPGEEVCFDYATSDGSPYDEFTCACGSAECRKRVTGEDWKIPALWDRYAGYFSPYLQARIDRLRAKQAG